MINQSGQTKSQAAAQFIVPSKVQFIFDVNQAYSAYSLPKIHYKQQYSDLPNVHARPSKHEQLDSENDNHKSKGDNNIFKEWNVNYQEDIQKRIASHKSLKQQENSVLLDNLKSISRGPPSKKSRLHRTKFKINKTNKNHPIIENTICQYINQNIQLKPDKNTSQKDYDNNAPFFIPSLAFAEELNEEKQHFKKKYGFDDKTLRKNKLILEEVVLLRLQKREKVREKNKLVNQIA